MILGTPDPVAFSVLGFDIRWYGICIAVGMLLGLIVAYFRAPRFGIKPDKTIDVTLVAILAGVVGARLYYVVFHWDYYGGDFWKIIDLRSGGLAIHGGLIFGTLAAILLCHFIRTDWLDILDLFIPSVALAQACGRWGNYFNQEAHGGPTDLPWAIEVDGEMVHPTFLYESIWCFLLFLLLLAVSRKRRFPGQIILLYGALYSLERFFVESLRTDSLMLGDLKAAMLVSAALFFVCGTAYIILLFRARRRSRIFY
ncbi:MAG: prolipoprotein diacylglyceryl transferase [Bacillota bacterium]|nr:prolipoprotein diacylglyceryl transferase [Bacillota bacterium]